MKKINLMMIGVITAFFFIPTTFGQTPELIPASAGWELTDPDNGGTGYAPATSGNVTAQDESAGSNTQIRDDYSGFEDSQRSQISGGAWPANQSSVIEDVYVQFALAPLPYSIFYLDSVALEMTAMAINTMKAEIRCSTDPTFSTYTQVPFTTGLANNYVPRDQFFKVNTPVDLTVNDGETLYVRVYFWVEDPTIRTGKYLCLRNVLISGKGESLPAPSSVTWFENGNESPVITGNILAGNPFYPDSLVLNDLTVDLPLDHTGTSLTAGTIKTASGMWNQETDTVSYLYFGFAVSPKFGGTYHIDSVNINIGAKQESDFMAAVYYSLNADFSDATLLFSDTGLNQDTLETWTTSMDTNIYTGQTFYLRIYPYDTLPANSDELVAINGVAIYGTITGITSDPPTVTTANLSYLSTTFVTCGGNIPSDGGSAVTERGVVWDTISGPTIDDGKTSDGSGSGGFVSQVTGLTPGKTYYLRAYGTNAAGTGYGDEKIFTSLASITVPTVTTASVSAVLVKTAESGGEVTDWGGDTVKVRGICWNTSGTPTIDDTHTENGQGLGSYNSTLYPLTETTTYYLRAYAVNSAGEGYGGEYSFTTQAPAPDVTKVVAKDGSGDYTTVQAAFDDVPDLYTGTWTIYVKPGTYYEKPTLAKNKVNVILKADHPDSAILTYDDNANTPGGSGTVGTSGSASVFIEADDFIASKITFQNTNQVAQAVALRTNGDRQSYYHCRMKGYQDTYYTYGLGRIYMKDCYLEGAVDYIFGQATVVFDSCELKELRNGGPLTAASTNVNSKFGYVFRNCKIMTDPAGYDGNTISQIYLGRPWQGSPKVVYMYCYEPATVAAAGWTNMTAGLNPLFAEYKCVGPGFKPEQRSTNVNYPGVQLTDEEAALYTPENILAKTTNPAFGIDWMPDTTSHKLSQTINFGPLEEKRLGQPPFTLSGTASSHLPLSYVSSNTDVATINGDEVTLTGTGTTVITASQEGNFLYGAAADAVQTLIVGEPSALKDGVDPQIAVFPNPVSDKINVTGLAGNDDRIVICNDRGEIVLERTFHSDNAALDISSLNAGLYFIKINKFSFKFIVE